MAEERKSEKNELQMYILKARDVTNTGFDTLEAVPLPICEPGVSRCGDPNCYESKWFIGSKPDSELTDEERSVREKMLQFKEQLVQLSKGKHPEFAEKIQHLNAKYEDRIKLHNVWKENAIKNAQLEYELEKKMIEEEYETQKDELRETIIAELEEKKRALENERAMMLANGDFIDPRPMIMRKLRRRPNELPTPTPERKKKIETPSEIRYEIDLKDAENDLKLMSLAAKEQSARRKAAMQANEQPLSSLFPISMPTTRSAAAAAAAAISGRSLGANNAKASSASSSKMASTSAAGGSSKSSTSTSRSAKVVPPSPSGNIVEDEDDDDDNDHPNQSSKKSGKKTTKSSPQAGDGAPAKEKFTAKVENGKLKYEKRWFLRGQPVYVEGKNLPRYSGIISSIKSSLIWVNRIDNSGSRLKVRISQLVRGKVTIKRRAN